MATKINQGLYAVSYVIDTHTLVEYTIERNRGDFENRPIGRWIVMVEVGNDEREQWDGDFATKRQALAEIEQVQASGRYEKRPGLGWCYNPYK